MQEEGAGIGRQRNTLVCAHLNLSEYTKFYCTIAFLIKIQYTKYICALPRNVIYGYIYIHTMYACHS